MGRLEEETLHIRPYRDGKDRGGDNRRPCMEMEEFSRLLHRDFQLFRFG